MPLLSLRRAWLVVCLALASTAGAQQPTRLLDRVIALDIDNAPVSAALDRIAQAADITLTFNRSEVERLPARISIHEPHITVHAALQRVLGPDAFDVRQVSATQIMLIRADSVMGLHGLVTDSLTGLPLSGINVLLNGTKTGTVTANDGRYRLRVPPTAGTLQFYGIGYRMAEIPFVVGGGAIDVVLARTAATLSAVQVEASKRAQPVAHSSDQTVVTEIKNSTSVVSGIASEQIAKSADINAAQIVKHISGVTVTDESFLVVRGMNQRYNATYLDDNLAPSTELYSRAFDLSLLPDRIIDRILVYKSPRADLIGDMTGAAVKIYTKDALAIRHVDFSIRIGDRPGGTFHDMLTYKGGGTDFLGFDNGTRALPSSVPPLGSFAHASLSQSQYINAFSPVLGDQLGVAPPDVQLTFNYYDGFRLGHAWLYNVTSASYTTENRAYTVYDQEWQSELPSDEQAQAQIHTTEHDQTGTQKATLNLMQNMTLRFNDHHQIYFKNFVLQQGVKATIDQTQVPNDTLCVCNGQYGGIAGTQYQNIILDWEQRTLYQGNLGGTHDLTSTQNLAWNVGLTASLHTIPDQRTARFENNSDWRGSYYYNVNEPYNLGWTAIDRVGSAPGGVYDQTGTISRVWTRNTETIYNGSLDYTASPATWLDVKGGTYDYWKTRDVARREYLVYDGELANNTSGIVDPGTGMYNPPGSVTYVNPNLIHFSPGQLNSIWNGTHFPNDGSGLAVVDATKPTDAYQATEAYDAGYLMATAKPFNGHLELNAGLRVEYDQMRLGAAVFTSGFLGSATGSGIADPILVTHTTTSWLPSVNLAWRPSPLFVARAAFGKTVNRPEFREVAPFPDYNYEDNSTVTGNPNLIQANVNNYDVRLELYPPGHHGDVLSIGAYDKALQNPIERIVNGNIATFIGYDLGDQITYINASKAIVRGVEGEFRKSLFWNLSAVANGSLIYSHVYAFTHGSGGPLESNAYYNRPLQGQAPYIVDLGLFYDNAPSGTKVAATYNISGTSIYAAGVAHAAPDTNIATANTWRGSILQLPQGLLELSITQSFGDAWRLKLTGQNLLNEATRFAQDENFDSKYEPERLVTINGVKQYVGDNIYRRYNLGQYFLLTLTHSF